MSRRALRIALGALATVAVLTLGAPTWSATYSPTYDPQFDGIGQITIPDPCLSLGGGNGIFDNDPINCPINLLFVDVSPFPFPSEPHYTSDFLPNISIRFFLVDGELDAFETSEPVIPTDFPVSCGTECTGGLDYFLDHTAVLTQFNGNPLFALYTLVRQPDNAAPEPGSLGLLLGGIGAAWLARRRKAAT